MEPDARIEITRGPDGDVVTVDGVELPGAQLVFSNSVAVHLAIPARLVRIVNARPSVRRIALGEKE